MAAIQDDDPLQRVTVVTPIVKERQAALRAEFDPSNDGWFSESINDKVSAQLGIVSRLCSMERPIHEDDIGTLADPKFKCRLLRPTELDSVYQDRSITVRRANDGRPER